MDRFNHGFVVCGPSHPDAGRDLYCPAVYLFSHTVLPPYGDLLFKMAPVPTRHSKLKIQNSFSLVWRGLAVHRFGDEDARRLSLATFLGASKLASESDEDVSVLRARVTSKNGTTERALLSMQQNQVAQHIMDAAKAAAERSREMGDESGKP